MSRLGSWRNRPGCVYEPAEDSALLLDAVVDRIDATDVVLDVGTGSGVIARELILRRGATVYGVDVNPHACRRALADGVPVVRGDLVSAFQQRAFDVVVCNPPYLPTDPGDGADDWLELALCGGPSGRLVTNRLLDDVGRVVRDNGHVFLLVSSLQDVDAIIDRARANGFAARTVSRDDSFPFEVLSVIQLDRTD